MSDQTVFVSYVADDAADARSLMNELMRAGVAIADRNSLVKPGFRAKAAVRDAINKTSRFLLCLSSRNGLPAAYADDELQTAIAAKRAIIPVRLTRCDIPKVPVDDESTIADLEPLDFYADREAGVERLLTVLPVSTNRREPARGTDGIELEMESLATDTLDIRANSVKATVKKGVTATNTKLGS